MSIQKIGFTFMKATVTTNADDMNKSLIFPIYDEP